MSNLGASFKKAREAAGLPLEKIASETRISTRFLIAIENEDFHLLPGGIFNRGFIRAYAERLGMDPDEAVADYDRVSDTPSEPSGALTDPERSLSRGSDRYLYLVAAGVLVVLIAVYYVMSRPASPVLDEQVVAVEESPPSEVETPTGAEPPAAAAAEETIGPGPEIATESSPAADSSSVPTTAQAPSPATPAAASTSTPSVPPPTRPTAPATTPSTAPPIQPSVPQAVAATAQSGGNALAVDLEVNEVSWVRVVTDGNVAVNDNFQPGTSRHFTAGQSISVTIGNAAGANLKVNGRDLGQLGREGQVREFVITPENADQIRAR